MKLTQDQLNIAQVSGFTVAERIDTPETVVTIFTKNGTDITNEFTKVVELLTNSDAEPIGYRHRLYYSENEEYPAHWGGWIYSEKELQISPIFTYEQEPVFGRASYSKAEQEAEPVKPDNVLQSFWDNAMRGYRFVISIKG